MFTKETTEVTQKVTTFRCDHCSFTCSREQDVLEHFRIKHADSLPRSTQELNGETYFYFDDERNYEIWARSQSLHCQVKSTRWSGPGWYVISTWQQRCPKNCCYDDCIAIDRKDPGQVQQQLEALTALLQKTPT